MEGREGVTLYAPAIFMAGIKKIKRINKTHDEDGVLTLPSILYLIVL